MPTIKDITSHLETIAPLSYQEGYDNAGLITGDAGWELSNILCCLDATEAVIDHAIQQGCNLVVAHHPIVFKGLKRINGINYVERTIIKAIKNDIAIYAIHTNLDNVLYRGVNSKIAEKLGLLHTRILSPKPETNSLEIGSGLIGELPVAMDEVAFLKKLKETMLAGCVRHTRLLGRPIKTVALCGGAGSFLLPVAIARRADVYITGDFKYHEFFDADGHLVIADIGHFESEQFTIDLLHEIISEKFTTFAPLKTSVNTNPVHYL
ncbi:MAG: Nif3-like dinuclear metal center hexameric protein [Saprospiraceae bacterium]|nr:Nif3-like dinuclear metal center hexameric protein [Saprospiraceae bacterium]